MVTTFAEVRNNNPRAKRARKNFVIATMEDYESARERRVLAAV